MNQFEYVQFNFQSKIFNDIIKFLNFNLLLRLLRKEYFLLTTMSIETEWENQLKDFFRSEGKGQNAIVDAVNKYFETSFQESNIVAVKFHGLDLTSLAFLWTTIQKSPVQCLLRCHDILNECRELDDFKSLFPGKSLPSLRFRLYQLPANASFQKFRVPQQVRIL